MSPKVKICGIQEEETLRVALDAGADFIGLVFHPPSPRHVGVEQAASLAQIIKDFSVSKKIMSVGLFVDPEDRILDEILSTVSLDMIQLHGSETAERVWLVNQKTKLPVIKALSVSTEDDFKRVSAYENVVDWLLFDAKPADPDLPGGTGRTFEWSLLDGWTFSRPWMLSGGLNADNVLEALSVLSPDAVDVSSGVESQRGVKDAGKTRAFISKVKGLSGA
ncbi:MAG: phosphoribosylanthranilate isomerase [Alphaproteobacteria bacterium]|nr:phosphoribosylanthranilate isomerase [Alphaproteobacteria bacterium]